MCPTITGGGETKSKRGSPVLGTREMSCASTSTPEDPAQSYCEKNGSVRALRGMRRADAVDAIRSMVNGCSSFHTAWKVSGRRRMIDSRDGREIASAIALDAVGIHFNVSKKPYATCRYLQVEQLYQQRVCRGVFCPPSLERAYH